MTAAAVLREDATLGTPGHDHDPMTGKPWTEDGMLRVLARHFAAQSWAPVPQVTVAMRDMDPHWSYGTRPRDEWADRRIDMLLMRPARKHGIGPMETLAVEVKVTRADFLNDVRNPAKQAPWRAAATRHAYAVPAGLVAKHEVPEGSGLIVVTRGHGFGAAEVARKAPYLPGHAPLLPNRVNVALAHRLAHLEAVTRGWHDNPAATVEDDQDLRALLKAAEKRAERAEKAADREEGKAAAWKAAHALAVGAGHPCRWCGEALKPLNPGKGWFGKWRHVKGSHDEACADAERQTRENDALAAYEAATETERAAKMREAARWAFTTELETEPWRAYLPINYIKPGRITTTGPEPADILPEGLTA